MANKDSIFGKQLEARKESDECGLRRSLIDLSDAVLGREQRYYPGRDISEIVYQEMKLICVYFRVEMPAEIPDTHEVNEIIDFVTHATSVMHRRVSLTGPWWKDGDGPLLAVRKSDGRVFALLPGKFHGYYFTDENKHIIRIRKDNCDWFETEAVCFYCPLPSEKMTKGELISFLLGRTVREDWLWLLNVTLAVLGVGLLTPMVTRMVFSNIIPTGSVSLIVSLAMLLLATAIVSYLITAVRTGMLDRIRQRMEVRLENAVMGRVINLPASFFHGKSSGGLSQSLVALRQLPTILIDALIGPALMAILSIIYVGQITFVSPVLSVPALVSLAAQMLVIVICIQQRSQIMKLELEGDIKTQGIVYPMITGIQRIRLSGSELRALSRWAKAYKGKAANAYSVKFPYLFQNELVTTISLLGVFWVFYVGLRKDFDITQFASFLASYSLVTANLASFSNNGQMIAYLLPIMSMIEPVLQEQPETSTGRKYIRNLRGGIDINHVSFRYREDQPRVLDDLDLHISPGEYVAIVGKSGCGKSTLLRLLLGF